LRNPRVSICIPTWNAAPYVQQAISSALTQTYGDFELLLVDDASTDETLDVFSNFKDGRIHVLRNARRLGIPQNWNQCLKLARGVYVKFLFQDDTLVQEALSRLVEALEREPAASLAFSRREIRYEGVDFENPPLQGEIYRSALEAFYSSVHGPLAGIDLVREALRVGRDLCINVVGEPSFTLVRRAEAIRTGGFDPRFAQLPDWDLWLRLAREGPLVFIDEPLGMFRVHPDAQSARNRHKLRTRSEFVRLLMHVRHRYHSELAFRERWLLGQARRRYLLHFVAETVRVPVRRIFSS